MDNEYIIGIDLGTTNSVVAILEGESPKVISNSEGSTRTPSVVSFLAGGEITVGDVARRQGAVNPSRTVYSIKRLMGRTPQDIEASGIYAPYTLKSTADSQLVVSIDDALYTPAQISSFILMKLKQAAEDHLGQTVTKAIVTVPAYFDDLQRQATREAGRLAGLEILRLVNEPTAAAMAYGLGKETKERIAIYDFGGGTFDMTILEISDGTFEVLTSQGDTSLGGDDIDSLLVQFLLDRFKENTGVNFEPDDMARRRLTEAAEKAKCELSLSPQALVHLPFLAQENGSPLHLDTTVRREDFEDLIEHLVERSLECCRAALADCDLKATEIDKVILVGGTTRIPLLQDMVEELFGVVPFKGINPDEIVALGAATQAGVLAGKLKEVILLDVTPHTLGVEVSENRMTKVIEKNTTIPAKVGRLFTTTEDGQEMVTIHVLQGESEKASENRSLGKFTLTSIAPAKAGTARVQVAFQINADGMVEVVAEDMATRKQQSLTLSLGGEGDTVQAARERATGAVSARRKRRRTRTGERVSSPEQGTPIGVQAASQPQRDQTGARTLRNSDSSVASVVAPIANVPQSIAASMSPDVAPASNQMPGPATPPASQDGTQPALDSSAGANSSEPGNATGLSPQAIKALSLIGDKAASATSYEVYLKSYSELQEYVRRNPADYTVAEGATRILMTLGECDGARALLKIMTEAPAVDSERISQLKKEFHARFPNDVNSTQPITSPAGTKEGVDTAIRSMEKRVTNDSGSVDEIDNLIQLYRRRLAHADDPATQYKLVQLLVRLERVDEAINILQRLVQHESYRGHSLKILGLCFWQKGLHYLAWQKFQQLPPSDEIKDILYRLAADMEDTDQLLNAKVVFQHLVNADPEFRDGADRLKKIEGIIRMEAGNREASLTPSIFLTLKDSRFVVLEEVNRGSMGIVYRARDKVLEEIVALKILNDYMTTDPSAVERFKREARAAKRLSHPHIVRIHDMFEYGNKKILSMEFIEGVDLKTVLAERKTLPLYEIAGIARPVCDALQYAHQQSIVHRDIKPANIMITNSNQVKVTDFGIAKVLLAGRDSTRSGSQIIGTPLYMSPEQIMGDDVDARTDIYSFGATMYELATGKPPFLDGNIEYHHLHTLPPPMTETVPLALQQIIFKCLEKKPEDRYPAISQVADALVKLSQG